MNQREVGIDTESFHEGLRRVLRQDPDVILIGELRDRETAETALQAAESGHLVLSTMHTVDAAETLSRMVEFFPASKQSQVRSILAGVLKGVVSQRLLPRAGGGRVAAVEVMVANARIQELIRENRPEEVPEAIAEGAFFQMQTLTQALIDLVVGGEVDEETAARRRPQPPRLHDPARARAQGKGARGVQRRSGRLRRRRRRRVRARRRRHPARGLMRACVRRLRAAEDGFTLSEMLVVLAILGIVVAAIAQLFTSGLISAKDQTNRTEAQQHARLGLDKLRREIHCAEKVTSSSGYPASAVTVTLGSYCQATGGATTVTWCTKDRNGATPPVAGAQPYTLWRYVGSTCSPPPPACSRPRDALGVEPRGRSERHRRQDLRR